jgi:hypothetical protein
VVGERGPSALGGHSWKNALLFRGNRHEMRDTVVEDVPCSRRSRVSTCWTNSSSQSVNEVGATRSILDYTPVAQYSIALALTKLLCIGFEQLLESRDI